MNSFKTLTVEAKALIASGLAVIFVLLVGGLAYTYATAGNRADCHGLTEELTYLNKEFQSSKESAEEIIKGLASVKYAEGFTTFSTGKHGIEMINETISKYNTEIPPCKNESDQRKLKALIDTNQTGIQELDKATKNLQLTLGDFQIRTLELTLKKKVEELKATKITISGALERGKHMDVFAKTEQGSKLISQAQQIVNQIDTKIQGYTEKTDDLGELEKRLEQITADTAITSSANELAGQIEKSLVSFVKPLQTFDPEKEKEKEKEAEEKEKETKAKEEKDSKPAEKPAPQVDADIVWIGENCNGSTFEYRKSYGWDAGSALEHARSNCKSSHAP